MEVKVAICQQPPVLLNKQASLAAALTRMEEATAIEGADVPTSFPGRSQLFRDDEWINCGDAIIVEPGGRLGAGPHHNAKSTLYASVDPEAARSERKSLDPAGHYGRPDLFELRFDRGRHTPVVFSDHG